MTEIKYLSRRSVNASKVFLRIKVFSSKSALIEFCGTKGRLQLWEKGYLPLPSFLSEHTIDELDFEITKLGISNSNEDFVRRNEQCDVLIMTGLDQRSDFLFDFARRLEFLDLVRCLLQKEAVPLNVEFFSKPPRSRVGTPAHQDQAFYKDFQDITAISFWIALDAATSSSGALQYGERDP